MVSPSTLIGPFEFERALTSHDPPPEGNLHFCLGSLSGTLDSRQNVHFPPVEGRDLSGRPQIQMDQSELRVTPLCEWPLSMISSQASQES